MGFASGFRTGLATGDVRRSAMPIVQGLGSMIDRIAARNKKGSVRFAGGDGPSSYDKYTARKDQEEAAAEEKRRYDTEQAKEQAALQKREAEETVQAERQAVAEGQQAEMHQEQIKSIQAERENAAALFERSEKKEKRIEAYRGFIQGIQSRNKALTEASWAALAPEMPKKEAQEFAPYRKEMVEDPATGEMVPKYIVGRDKDGKESETAMPAPSIDFNDNGSIAVSWPGSTEPEIYADANEFAKNVGYHLNPEFETGKGKKKEDADKTVKRARADRDDKLKMLDRQKENLQAKMDAGSIELEEFDKKMAGLAEKEDKLIASLDKKDKGKKVAKKLPENIYAGEDPPEDYPDAQRAPDGKWWVPDPDNPGQWIPVLEDKETMALAKSH